MKILSTNRGITPCILLFYFLLPHSYLLTKKILFHCSEYINPFPIPYLLFLDFTSIIPSCLSNSILSHASPKEQVTYLILFEFEIFFFFLLQFCHELCKQTFPVFHFLDAFEAIIFPILHGKFTECCSARSTNKITQQWNLNPSYHWQLINLANFMKNNQL